MSCVTFDQMNKENCERSTRRNTMPSSSSRSILVSKLLNKEDLLPANSSESIYSSASSLSSQVSPITIKLNGKRTSISDDIDCSKSYSSISSADSGVESDVLKAAQAFQLDNELSQKIVKQVEFYFSDENLIHDEFLLKHIRRNKSGWVSLKLISSLRRVKALIKDWQIVGHVIEKSSSTLLVSEDGMKVKRKKAVAQVDGSQTKRTIVLFNLPENTTNLDSLTSIFSHHGQISLIRIFGGQNSPPMSNKLNSLAEKHPQMKAAGKLVATIEFTREEDAIKAEKQHNNNWRKTFEVIPMSGQSNASTGSVPSSNTRSGKRMESQSFSSNELLVKKSDRDLMNSRFKRQKSKSMSCHVTSSDPSANEVSTPSERKPSMSGKQISNSVIVIRTPKGPDGQTNGFSRRIKA